MANIHKAGLLPMQVIGKQIQLLVQIPNDPYGEWSGEEPQVSKGHIEKNETPLMAAIREAEEELGILSSSFLHIPKIIGTNGGVTFFGVLVKENPDMQPFTFETKEIKWMTPNIFGKVGRKDQIWVVLKGSKLVKKWLDMI